MYSWRGSLIAKTNRYLKSIDFILKNSLEKIVFSYLLPYWPVQRFEELTFYSSKWHLQFLLVISKHCPDSRWYTTRDIVFMKNQTLKANLCNHVRHFVIRIDASKKYTFFLLCVYNQQEMSADHALFLKIKPGLSYVTNKINYFRLYFFIDSHLWEPL